MDEMRFAAISVNGGPDQEANIARAEALIAQAVQQGVDWVVLPEMFSFRGDVKQIYAASEMEDGPLNARLAELSRRHQIANYRQWPWHPFRDQRENILPTGIWPGRRYRLGFSTSANLHYSTSRHDRLREPASAYMLHNLITY